MAGVYRPKDPLEKELARLRRREREIKIELAKERSGVEVGQVWTQGVDKATVVGFDVMASGVVAVIMVERRSTIDVYGLRNGWKMVEDAK